ncbi:hypothetical protein SYNPS1DRAFT_28706, partial [Syncephalis pseudoplumigaleata]
QQQQHHAESNTAPAHVDSGQQDDREGIKRRGLDHSEHGQIVIRLPGTRQASVLSIPSWHSPGSPDTPARHLLPHHSGADGAGHAEGNRQASSSRTSAAHAAPSSTQHQLTNRETSVGTAACARMLSALDRAHHPAFAASSSFSSSSPSHPPIGDAGGHRNGHTGPSAGPYRAQAANAANAANAASGMVADGCLHGSRPARPCGGPLHAQSFTDAGRQPCSSPPRSLDSLGQRRIGHLVGQQHRSDPSTSSALPPISDARHARQSGGRSAGSPYSAPIHASLPRRHSLHRRLTNESPMLPTRPNLASNAPAYPTSPHHSVSHISPALPAHTYSRWDRMLAHDYVSSLPLLPELEAPVFGRGVRSRSMQPIGHRGMDHASRSSMDGADGRGLRLPSLQGWLRDTSLPLSPPGNAHAWTTAHTMANAPPAASIDRRRIAIAIADVQSTLRPQAPAGADDSNSSSSNSDIIIRLVHGIYDDLALRHCRHECPSSTRHHRQYYAHCYGSEAGSGAHDLSGSA